MKISDLFLKRRERRITQAQLAQAIGVDENTMGALERGAIDITAEEHSRINAAIDHISESRSADTSTKGEIT